MTYDQLGFVLSVLRGMDQHNQADCPFCFRRWSMDSEHDPGCPYVRAVAIVEAAADGALEAEHSHGARCELVGSARKPAHGQPAAGATKGEGTP